MTGVLLSFTSLPPAPPPKKKNLMTSFVLAVAEAPTETEPKFNPFTGVGRRLDGKPLTHEPAPVSSSGSKEKRPDSGNGNAQPSAGSSSQSTNRQTQGKLVFGSNVNRGPKETEKVLVFRPL